MNFSKKSQHGIRAMAEPALYYNKEPLSARSVSNNQSMPLQYLEQIFSRLKQGGLVRTTRGPKGGHILSKAPSNIMAKDIVELLDERYSVVERLGKEFKAFNPKTDTCLTMALWERLDRSAEKILVSASLKDLCVMPKPATGNGIKHKHQFQI